MNARDYTPFISPWLFEANLTSVEFHVLCYLWRCAGKAGGRDGKCFPGYENICRACGIGSENTLAKALRSLEQRGLIRRRKGRNNRNLFELFTLGSVAAPSAMTEESFETALVVPFRGVTQAMGVTAPAATAVIAPTAMRRVSSEV